MGISYRLIYKQNIIFFYLGLLCIQLYKAFIWHYEFLFGVIF